MNNLFRKLILPGLISLLFYMPIHAQSIQIQGEQTGILEADTVFLVGDVVVPSNGTLTFMPGTKIIATGFFGFQVVGRIIATGSEQSRIVFSVADTSGFFNPENGRGGWNGFHFTTTGSMSDSSLFTNCTFEFGKAFGDSLEKMGGIFNIRQFSRIRIENCEFNNNRAYYWGGAIFNDSGNILIRNCNFSYNSCGSPAPPYGYGGAVCIRYADVNLTGCTFYSNSSTGIGGALSLEFSDVLVQSNKFHNNYSALGGALGYLRSTPLKPVVDNLFTGNTSLFFGGAISCNRANPKFINNTITNNSSVSYGGGFYCNDSAVPLVVNCIIYGNYAPSGEQVYIWDIYSAPEFYFCNIQGGREAFGGTGGSGFISPYINNLDTLPGFTGIEPHPYSLANDSPCINSGNPDTTGLMLPLLDLAGNIRIAGGTIDIGAYENLSGTTGIAKPNKELNFYCYPNPFSREITFILPASPQGKSFLTITDMQGKEVLCETNINTGSYTWRPGNIPGSGLQPGIYIAAFTIDNHRLTCKVILTD